MDLKGKNMIITGVNCGMGYESALVLAKRGNHNYFNFN